MSASYEPGETWHVARNHFPASWHLGRKDLLWRNLRAMQQRFPDGSFDLMPQTFLLPGQFKFWQVASREMSRLAG